MLSVQRNWHSFKAWILFIIRYGKEDSQDWQTEIDNYTKTNLIVMFKPLIAGTTNVTVFLDTTLFSLIYIYQSSSKTSVNIYQNTWNHIPVCTL